LRWQESWRLSGNFDGVVLEASGSLIDTTVALLRSTPVALWGHIASFTGTENRLDRAIERWQLKHADVVLPYTEAGKTAALDVGVEPERIFVLNNTIDTGEIIRAADELSPQMARDILGLEDRDASLTFAYIGGLDSSKRIDFLAHALDLLQTTEPQFRLLVAGEGSDAGVLSSHVARGQVQLLGRVDARQKAALASTCNGILMPGRVGLVAVDSLVLGLPIVTTAWPFHAPEFQYLTPGEDCVVTADDVESFVAGVKLLLHSPESASRLRRTALARAERFSIERMVAQFVDASRQLVS
jgi:glycosyltransferase involved in cell wall biosynthesis